MTEPQLQTDDKLAPGSQPEPERSERAGGDQRPDAAYQPEPAPDAGFGPAPDDERLVRDEDYAADKDPVAALWGAGGVEGYRQQWRELQLQFVDDPAAATTQAATLVDDAVRSLTTALTEQKQQLDAWQQQPGPDSGADDADHTERLRVALREYRDFLDRLLGM
jgi:hypothetical protein